MNQHAASQRIQQFEDQGYVILKDVVDLQTVSAVRQELSAIVDQIALGLRAMDHVQELYESEPFETRLIKLFSFAPQLSPTQLRTNLHRPGMFGLFFHPRVLDLAEVILGPEIRLYPNYTVRPKLPEDEKTLVLWHQDAGYTADNWAGKDHEASKQLSAADLRMVNVWSPLVKATAENGCMQFIPGTHKLGVVPHVERKHYLEIAESILKPRLKDAVDIELNPGDVVLFSNLLFHSGQPNRSKMIRWSCDWRYQDATQPTLRKHQGHLARSAVHPDKVVQDASQWAALKFS
ncbi:MAG: phytanoyl-CoA dioxygenase family protein [Phycisphaerales bacterium]|nr:phytanoyl-CoA dioxygenase family protein [Phycisphaerales bacterium]